MNTKFKFHINANSLINFSLGLFILLYFLPITITLPGMLRKPLLVIGFVSFVGALIKKHMNYLFIYFIAICFALLFYWTSWRTVLSFASFMFPAFISMEFLVCALMVADGSVSISKRIIGLLFVVITITAVTSIKGVIEFPLAIRTLGQGTTAENVALQRMFRRRNIAGWGLIYGMAFLEGPLMYEYKKKKSVLLIVIIIINAVCIFLSQLMFAILLSIGITFFVLINGKNKKFILRILFCLLALLILWAKKEWILTEASNLAGSIGLTMIQLRIKNLSDLILLKDTAGDAAGRFALYKRGLDSLLEHPFGLFFVNTDQIENILGFHSDFFDILGSLGLFGIIILVLMTSGILTILKRVKDGYNKRFVFVMEFAFFVIFLINPVLSQPHIWFTTLLLPAVLAFQGSKNYKC